MAKGLAAFGHDVEDWTPRTVNLVRYGRRCRLTRSGGSGFVLGRQIGDQLGYLRVCQRVAKGWHLQPAVQDLVCDLFWGPNLVLVQVGQRRGLFSADPFGAVAMRAILLAEKEGASLLVGFCGMGFVGGQCGLAHSKCKYKRQCWKRKFTPGNHRSYFLIRACRAASNLLMRPRC